MIIILHSNYKYKNLIVGVVLIILGILIIYYGITYKNVSYVNLGLAGLFVGLVIVAFLPSDVINLDAYVKTVLAYQSFLNNVVEALNLKGNPIFIPPYPNLSKGGIFVSKYKNFSINLGLFDEETFLTHNGLLINPPIGYKFVDDFESYSDIKLKDADLPLTISITSSVLKAYGFIESIEFEEEDECIKLIIEDLKISCGKICKIPCPIISSIIYAISISLNQLILVEHIERQKSYVRIQLKKLGTVDNYLW